MPKLEDALKRSSKKLSGPVWEGPCGEGPNGGITQSLLSRFLVCRERFRLLVVEGLKPKDSFNHRLEFGSMWHLMEEYHAEGMPAGAKDALREYARGLMKKYPTAQEQIDKWYNVVLHQFPVYVDYWSKHPDVQHREPLLQEETFDVPYTLPSSRTVRLRGKWDSVDLIGKGKTSGLYLQENKTKGDIVEERIKNQLRFDLQTMFYLVAIQTVMDSDDPDLSVGEPPVFFPNTKSRVAGVRYNVIRRPLSGGKYSISPKKAKTYKTKPDIPAEKPAEFYRRLQEVIIADPGFFFMRWRVEVTPGDLERFRREFLDPILEQLCDWWEWIVSEPENIWVEDIHWRHPYGCYNSLNEGGATEMDEYLETGSELGLQRVDKLFGELD